MDQSRLLPPFTRAPRPTGRRSASLAGAWTVPPSPCRAPSRGRSGLGRRGRTPPSLPSALTIARSLVVRAENFQLGIREKGPVWCNGGHRALPGSGKVGVPEKNPFSLVQKSIKENLVGRNPLKENGLGRRLGKQDLVWAPGPPRPRSPRSRSRLWTARAAYVVEDLGPGPSRPGPRRSRAHDARDTVKPANGLATAHVPCARDWSRHGSRSLRAGSCLDRDRPQLAVPWWWVAVLAETGQG